MRQAVRFFVAAVILGLFVITSVPLVQAQRTTAPKPVTPPQPPPTVAEAEAFIRGAEAKLNDLSVKASRASWVQSNFITDDTEVMSADANEVVMGVTTQLAKDATRFDHLQMPPELARKMLLLKLLAAVPAPAPSDPTELAELARIGTSLEADYGKGKYCPTSGKHAGQCLDIGEIEHIMETSTDPDELKDVWVGWATVGPPMRDRYTRWVTLGNTGAHEMGFSDLGAMWRAGYDMTPEQFSAEIERLWQQVKPLYDSLHAYVRTKLVEKYGPTAVDADGRIRADLLGNPWAQEWGNIFPIVAPPQQKQPYDITELLKAKNVDPIGMVKYGQGFFESLGFAPLPKTFWERSLFVKPKDRDVVCHASAWDIDNFDDLRLKMCIQVRTEDFITVHHELGHNMYQRAYENQLFPPRAEPTTASTKPSWRHHRTVDHARVPEQDRPAGDNSAVGRHRLSAANGFKQGCIPAVRLAHRSVALEGLQRRYQAGRLQQGVVADARAVSRHLSAGRAHGVRLRSGGQVSRGGQRSLHAVFSGSDSAVPVLSRHVSRGRVHRAALSLLVLR